MNLNKIIIYITIIIVAILIIAPTIYKVNKNHNDNLYLVVEEKIINAATECYYDDVCLEETIYLSDLYENDYLEMVSDPVTKEYYNELSYVKRDGITFTFVKVE